MNEMPAFDRRRDVVHAPLPGARNPYRFCTHVDPYCTVCARDGTLLLENHDVETRSWWIGAPRVVS